MTIQDKETLKGYFNDGDLPMEYKYADLIDSMGGEAYGLGSEAALATGDWNNYKTTGFYRGYQLANGPTSSWYWVLVIRHSDTYVSQEAVYYYGLNAVKKYIRRCVNGTWDAWVCIYPAAWADITGKPSTYPPSSHTHPGGDITSAVANATAAVNSDKLDNYHASDLYRDNANFATSGYLDTSNYVDAAGGIRENGTQIHGLVMYSAPDVLTNSSWLIGVSHVAGQYTMTQAMFGWPTTANYLYLRVVALAASGSGYVGCNNVSGNYNFSVAAPAITDHTQSEYGIVRLTSEGGSFYVRVGGCTCYVQLEIWGYFL